MIELIYIQDLYEPKYLQLLKDYYGQEYLSRIERAKWYRDNREYKILVAKENGKYIGQSCVCKETAHVNGKIKDIWWGVDTFVLPTGRGKGIGKALQGRLHKDFDSMSSIWYSRTNGIIKNKCGARPILSQYLTFYPISSFFSVICRGLLNKLFHKDYHNHISILYNKYLPLYYSLSRSNVFSRTISLDSFISNHLTLINQSLERFDFRIKRDECFYKWKLKLNPQITGYHILEFIKSDNQELLGSAIITDPFIRKTFGISLNVVMILEVITYSNQFPIKNALAEIMKYIGSNYRKVDGVLTLGNNSEYPSITFPINGLTLLSNGFTTDQINSSYLGLIDQDMEQMI